MYKQYNMEEISINLYHENLVTIVKPDKQAVVGGA